MYKFCKANGGWWYVCDAVTGLMDYYEHTRFRVGKLCLRESLGMPSIDGEEGMRTLAALLSRKTGKSMAESYAYIESTIFSSQFVAVLNGSTVFINENGGYNFGFPESDIQAVVYLPKFLFPHYTPKDIRVSKFSDGGTHYYAHVGEIEVSSGTGIDKAIKWDSYEEAYENALRYCGDT